MGHMKILKKVSRHKANNPAPRGPSNQIIGTLGPSISLRIKSYVSGLETRITDVVWGEAPNQGAETKLL